MNRILIAVMTAIAFSLSSFVYVQPSSAALDATAYNTVGYSKDKEHNNSKHSYKKHHKRDNKHSYKNVHKNNNKHSYKNFHKKENKHSYKKHHNKYNKRYHGKKHNGNNDQNSVRRGA